MIISYCVNFNVFLKEQKCAAAKCTYMDLCLFCVSIKSLKYRETPSTIEDKVRYCVSEIYFCLFVCFYSIPLLCSRITKTTSHFQKGLFLPQFTNMDPLGTATFFCVHTSLIKVDRSEMDPHWANNDTVICQSTVDWSRGGYSTSFLNPHPNIYGYNPSRDIWASDISPKIQVNTEDLLKIYWRLRG